MSAAWYSWGGRMRSSRRLVVVGEGLHEIVHMDINLWHLLLEGSQGM
jgi:hypothetical protein